MLGPLRIDPQDPNLAGGAALAALRSPGHQRVAQHRSQQSLHGIPSVRHSQRQAAHADSHLKDFSMSGMQKHLHTF